MILIELSKDHDFDDGTPEAFAVLNLSLTVLFTRRACRTLLSDGK